MQIETAVPNASPPGLQGLVTGDYPGFAKIRSAKWSGRFGLTQVGRQVLYWRQFGVRCRFGICQQPLRFG
jgi:hypothetical protein